MKKIFLLSGLLASILIFTQCGKSEATPEKQILITYPVTENFGKMHITSHLPSIGDSVECS
jgi:hypothetical protein